MIAYFKPTSTTMSDISASAFTVSDDVELSVELASPNSVSINIGGESRMLYRHLVTKAVKAGKIIKIDTAVKNMRMVDSIQDAAPSVAASSPEEFDPTSLRIETTRLRDIEFDPRLFEPIQTGTYLDSFFSYKNGIMPGINVMLTGDPGVGKSSNLMDILVNTKQEDDSRRVLYISAEMNEIDVKEFEQYYPGISDIDFLYIANYLNDPDLGIKPYQALLSVLNQGWDLVVMDSLVEIQSLIQDDLGLTGKKSEKWILDLLRKHNSGHNEKNIYTTFLCIQQKNKGGTYVGSKRLEHMTSAFLNLGWDAKEKGKRYMMFEKNRKGKEKVKLYYSFAKEGGLVYDEDRHRRELAILERLQTPTDAAISDFDITEFEKLFSESDTE